MFTAKVKSKIIDAGVLKIDVEFTDGETTITEWCKPQNEDGLMFWIKSRLEVFNSSKVIDLKLSTGDTLEIEDSVVVIEESGPQIQIRNNWFAKLNRLQRAKTYLIDNGIVQNDDAGFIGLLQEVKNEYKPEYIDFI